MTDIRVTIDEKLNLLLDELVASGLFPSKAELMRSGLVHLLKDLGLLQNLINPYKKASNTKPSIPLRKDKRQKVKGRTTST